MPTMPMSSLFMAEVAAGQVTVISTSAVLPGSDSASLHSHCEISIAPSRDQLDHTISILTVGLELPQFS